MERRKFIKNLGVGAAALGACLSSKAAPAFAKTKPINWKMVKKM